MNFIVLIIIAVVIYFFFVQKEEFGRQMPEHIRRRMEQMRENKEMGRRIGMMRKKGVAPPEALRKSYNELHKQQKIVRKQQDKDIEKVESIIDKDEDQLLFNQGQQQQIQKKAQEEKAEIENTLMHAMAKKVARAEIERQEKEARKKEKEMDKIIDKIESVKEKYDEKIEKLKKEKEEKLIDLDDKIKSMNLIPMVPQKKFPERPRNGRPPKNRRPF